MDFIERIFFLFLAGMALFVGFKNIANQGIFMTKVSSSIEEIRMVQSELKLAIKSTELNLSQIKTEFSLITNLSDEARKALTIDRLINEISSNDEMLKEIIEIIEKNPKEAWSIAQIETELDKKVIALENRMTFLSKQYEDARTYNHLFIGTIFAILLFVASNSRRKETNVENKKDENSF